MEHSVVPGAQPWGLGLNETLLPQYLKELGYKTHIIGKVHRAKGPFRLSVTANAAMSLAISLIEFLRFLMNQMSHSKNGLQPQLIKYI